MNQLHTFENLLRSHANLIENTHREVAEMRGIIDQLVHKIVTVDEFAQNVDRRLTTTLTGVKERYDPLAETLNERIGMMERVIHELREEPRVRPSLSVPVPPGIQYIN